MKIVLFGATRMIGSRIAAELEVAPGVRHLDEPTFREEWKPEALQQADALEVYRGDEVDRLGQRWK